MRLFYVLSQVFLLGGLALGLYDFINQWLVKAHLKISTLEEFWKGISKDSFESGRKFFESFLSHNLWKLMAGAPVPVMPLALALFFYIVYRILFAISGKSRSSRL